MTGERAFRIVAFAALGCLFAGAAHAASIMLSSAVSAERITMNDRLELTIAVTGPDTRKAGAPQLRAMTGFTVAGTSTSTEFQFINGRSSTLVSYTYALVPRSTGVFEVGGATVMVDGRAFTIEPKKVEVAAGAPPPQARSDGGSVTGGSGDADLFIRTTVDNRQPWVGEQATLTFELFNRLPIWGDTEYEPPSTTGFWSVDLPKIAPSTQNANSRLYKYNAVKTALFPTTSGTLTIGPAKLTYTTGGFLSSQQTRTLATKPIAVRVKPLPETGKPTGFSGAVGNFRISSEADKTETKVGDVVTLTVTVSGEGNLDMIASVGTPDFSSFRTYDPKVATKILNSGFTVGGAKVWEFVLVPKFAGTVTVQSFTLVFFNPKAGKYQTVSTAPVTLKIAPGELAAADAERSPDSRNQVEAIADDIRFIKPDRAVLPDTDRRLVSNPLFYLSYIVPLGLFAGAFLYTRRRDAIERDHGLRRKISAWKKAQKSLELAVQAHRRGENVVFCGHLTEAIVRFIGDRLNTDTGPLTTGAIEDTLVKSGVSPEIAEKVRKTLELCDFVRFSSSAEGRGVEEALLADARALLQSLRDAI